MSGARPCAPPAARAGIRGRGSSTICICAGCSTTCGPRWRGSPSRAASSSTCSAAAARTTTSSRPACASSGSTSTTATAWPTSSRPSSCRAPTAATTASRASRRSTTSPIRRTASESSGASSSPAAGWSWPCPLVWEYDRDIVEHRYTSGSLRQLFDGWDDVVVVENGGRAVAWTLLTGTLLRACEEELGRRLPRAAVRAVVRAGVRRPERRGRGARRHRAAPPASAPRARAQHLAHRQAAGRWLTPCPS